MNVKLNDKQKIKVINSDDIYRIMQQVLLRENKIDRDKEHFWLVCLAQNNKILMIELISLGSVNATIVEPMDVFSFALQKRAVQLIMVHNHPSGDTIPSAADIDITERMYAIGKFVKVPVIDHLIITESSYRSFSDEGIMRSITLENKYDLTFKEMDAMKMKIEKNREINIAKKLLKQGLDVKMIAKATGLRVGEIKELMKK